mmetsp:Transcript_104903/g.313418  ORF Transcript_104903/g.313418 Transcript_104903/m.313418 type:complete len:265 (+) Transcript_104903:300-1094(+)
MNSPERKASRQMEHCCSSAWLKHTRGRLQISASLSRVPASAAPICRTLRELWRRPSSSAASQLRTRLSSSAARRRRKPVIDSSTVSTCELAEVSPVMPKPTNSSESTSDEFTASPMGSWSMAGEAREPLGELPGELSEASSSSCPRESARELSACEPRRIRRKKSRSSRDSPGSLLEAAECREESKPAAVWAQEVAGEPPRLPSRLPIELSRSTLSSPRRSRARLSSEGLGLEEAGPREAGGGPATARRLASAARVAEAPSLYS